MSESNNPGMALTPVGASPRPFEVLVAQRPAAFMIGDSGFNRAPVETCMIEARDDLGAIDAWLEEFADSPRTHRAYTKEIERFYNWLVLVQGKSLAAVTRTDILAYEKLLTAPFASWCGPRNRKRHTDEWRPFEGPLSPRSRAQALVIVGACFSFLVSARYLLGNPFVVGRARRRALKRKARKKGSTKGNYLSLPTFGKLARALELHIEGIEPSKRYRLAAAERMLFAVRFLANTGLRREELAQARMSDIERIEHPRTGLPYWMMSVTGKGEVTRRVALNDSALDALQRYRVFHGASAHFSGNASAILLPLAGEGGPDRFLTDQMVYNIVQDALKVGEDYFVESDPETAARFARATPHWFRHTFATLLDDLGANPKLIQLQLGHESITTTMSVYVGTEELELVEAIAGLRI